MSPVVRLYSKLMEEDSSYFTFIKDATRKSYAGSLAKSG